jgi:NhaP-type Na+/H+ or K+/H+ antiporter
LSLAIIVLFGLVFNKAFDHLSLPGLLGMLVLGVVIGPYGFDLMSQELLTISPDLRKIALIVILIRAGLGLKKDTLKKIGIPAVRMSFIPGLLEGFTIMFVASYLLDVSIIEAGMLAFIIAAVSPAVIVPQMLNLINKFPSSESKIYYKENQMVKKGETVCIIEAMKVMNEITAPQDGKVMKIHMNNGESVMVEQVLMEIV